MPHELSERAGAGLLARLAFRLQVWISARTLPARIAGRDFSQILSDASSVPPSSWPRFPVSYIARAVRRVARWPILMRNNRCLRTGLVGFAALRRCGYDPRLHFSVDPKSMGKPSLSAHCWVTLDGVEVINARIPGQVQIHVHAAPGHTPADPRGAGI
ncbi:hypothetical protein VW23_008900 [Devosia insulae DS-56]|uniref:Microcin J25-processing protein McjB C-terminal domain-containing protein n=1 Tax=Devosia insulae DS-56 TaxID=1116389 RepID=A0A1E5XWG8_9HYPH|nr:lasso peptide biosynthesis B2 protein [Devosia insulae]OEO32922.1 hypothetical protein VW23_008900 [Devosia insulae DS-56]